MEDYLGDYLGVYSNCGINVECRQFAEDEELRRPWLTYIYHVFDT
jgi:hypothetical protein